MAIALKVKEKEEKKSQLGKYLLDEGIYKKLEPLGYKKETCEQFAFLIREIEKMKAEKKAVFLVHNYQRPEIFWIADHIGDSLGLSREAAKTDAELIVFCGVNFMAETAKILNPEKTVLLPNIAAGCSLCDTITAEELKERKEELKKKYPDLAVVAYVNTRADVKAESDACCTSANAVEVVNYLPNENILFVPDKNLAAYVQTKTNKNILPWHGDCYVHQQITPENILEAKGAVPNAKVLVHPECRRDVIELADAVFGTEGMVKYAKESDAKEFIVVTECGLSDRLFLEVPEKKFYKTCKLCSFMKVTTLADVFHSMKNLQYQINLPEETIKKARKALDVMVNNGDNKKK